MSTVDERDLQDQSQYLASRIYDDPGSELDLFFACASYHRIGSIYDRETFAVYH